MDYPIHIDTISIELSILYFKRLVVKILYKIMYVLILANNADPDEMPPYAASAFHLGLHC